MRSSRAVRFGLALGVVALLALGWSALMVYAQGGSVSGVVSSPLGYPLPAGTVVQLHQPGGEEVYGVAVPNLADGSFQFSSVPNGLYVVRAVPPVTSGLTPSLPKAVSVFGGNANVGTLALTTPQVTGTVVAPDGVTPVTATVHVYAGGMVPVLRVEAPAGRFALGGLVPGSYAVEARRATADPFWRSARRSVSVPGTSGPITLTLRPAELWGVVEDAAGRPVNGARVVVANRDGTHADDRSGPGGFWAVGGLAAGTYWAGALPPPYATDLMPSAPLSVTVPGAGNPLTLTLEAPRKVVTGTVKTNTGTPVFHALVVARRVDHRGRVEQLTGVDGSYQMQLGPGVWALTVRHVTDTAPADWVHPHAPKLVRFAPTPDPEVQEVNFTVMTADAQVTGTVTLPGGGVPGFTVTVALRNDEGVGVEVRASLTDGSFAARLPHGSYKVAVRPENPGYLGPAVEPVNVPPNGTASLGTLELVARDALITGRITTTGVPAGVEGVPVVAWRPGVPGSVRTRSGPGGIYALAVSSGTWQVRPAPTPRQPFVFTGEPQAVTVMAGQAVTDVNFTLVRADATIAGVLVDADGTPVTDAQGWATARKAGVAGWHTGAPILNGTFEIRVPAGTYAVAAHLQPGAPYMSAGERPVTVAAGERAQITLTVRAKDAAIAGVLVDPRQRGRVIQGVPGVVAAWSGTNWAVGPIHPGSGAYRLEVAAGVWRLNYRIEPMSDYVKLSGGRNVAVESGKTAVVPLPVTARDGRITGTVLAPDGSPLPGAVVVARGLDGDIRDVRLHTRSRADGSFELRVPHGRYRLGAAYRRPGWLKPVEREVTVPAGGVSGGHVLQFRRPDAVLRGTLTVTDTAGEGPVFVWAWSEEGSFTSGLFTVTQVSGADRATGTYRLDVISGTVWHVGAVFEDGSSYWRGSGQVEVTGTEATLDVVLAGPEAKPGPVVVTFDADEPQRLELADGTTIFIPAGAMPVSGTVTLRVVPIAAVPSQRHANVVGYGYIFLASDESGMPIEANFNQEVVITFPYDEARLRQQGILESRLKPAYFSTTTNEWTVPESFVVDTAANRVTMQIDHFTRFALMGEPGGALTYLPLVAR